ncbi:DUF1801 domain-containing protein [Aromatoleum petrolei]|uniref:DUF1801 domain-containing protein n=1 Tax=Aromatoleum petrolei TaxID=76116 RepID=A0ABX1MW95_9RHOO|nr:DUF1801 domain-containing protein [Aromatoleum petrolei]NMF91521.1 DUF1801 domain-containing protein [Aromatoleum petrolei]QTQ34532.1 putative protein DUF1801 [Aromatoleum petrolei]
MPADRISKLLEDIRLLDSERFEIVQALRKIVLGLAPSISEEVKYGGILFSAEKPFCGIFSYAKHVSLEFGAGASLPDKFKVLEGEGKLRRHIKLTSVPDIAEKHVGEYLLLALKASPKPLDPTRRSRGMLRRQAGYAPLS